MNTSLYRQYLNNLSSIVLPRREGMRVGLQMRECGPEEIEAYYEVGVFCLHFIILLYSNNPVLDNNHPKNNAPAIS